MTLLKAVEAGADVVDTAVSCFSTGTSQPATETMRYVFEQYGYDTGLDIEKVNKVNSIFKPYRNECLKSGLENPISMSTDTDALNYQIPGGMLSNLIKQLTDMKKLDKLDEVLTETPKVRADLGYPPLVTPMSQMVGAQAMLNVMSGERYKTVSNEVKAYLKGEYGKAPGTVNADLQKKVLGDEKPITCRFADTLKPGLPEVKEKYPDATDEEILSRICYPQQAEAYYKKREEEKNRTYTYKIEKV